MESGVYWLRLKDGSEVIGIRPTGRYPLDRVSWPVMYLNGTYGAVDEADIAERKPIKKATARQAL